MRSREDVHEGDVTRAAAGGLSGEALPESLSEALPGRPRHPSYVPRRRRLAASVVHRIRIEWAALIDEPVALLRARGPLAFPLATSATLLVFVLWLGTLNDYTWQFVMWVSGVYHALPFWLVLVRLPLSLFAPAPDLPVWGALAQVFAAFMLCEYWIGWRRTLLAAELITAVTTLAGHVMVLIGYTFSIGLPELDAYELDTGPSTAVVAMAVYIGLRRRAYLPVALVVATMGGEEIVLPNLAGREHLVAIALGVVLFALAETLWPRLRARTAATPAPPEE